MSKEVKKVIKEAKEKISEIEVLIDESLEILNFKINEKYDDDLMDIIENLELIKDKLWFGK